MTRTTSLFAPFAPFALFTLTSIALSSGLMAAEPLNPDAQPLQRVAKLNPATALLQLKDMQANEACIDSILKNEKAKTAMDKLKTPVVLNSMEDALKHLTRESMEKIDVNFQTQKVVIFVWQGSGQDQLSSRLSRHHRATAIFEYKPGRTDDLRTHSVLYSMRKDMQIKVFKDHVIIDCDGPGNQNGAQVLPGGQQLDPKVQPQQLQNGIQLRVQPQKKEP